jgi:mannosyltransferase
MAIDTAPPPRTPAPAPSKGSSAAGRWSTRLGAVRSIQVTTPLIVVGLLLLTAASVVLRTRQISFLYWIDEGISVGIASHPLSQLPHLLREDGSPPLYYALLHVWMSIFGHGEVATHWLSEVFAAITIPVSYWAAASLFGRRAAVMSALLAAGVPFLTTYAQETRMYSLAVLLSLLVALAFTQAFVYRRRRYLPLFGLSMAAALYTHNWALFLGLAALIAYLFCVWAAPAQTTARRDLWRDGLIGFGIAAVLYLPWLPTLLYQAQHTGAPWALPPVFWSLTTGFYFIAGGRGAAMTLLLGAGAGLLALRSAGPTLRPSRIVVGVLLILGVATVIIAWVYAKTTPAWAGRYLAVIIGPLILLAGYGLSRARGLGIVALVFVCLFWTLDPRPTARVTKSNVGLVAAAMRHHVGPTTLVLSTQPEQVPDIAYYLPTVKDFATPLGRVPDPRVVDWRNALERFRRSSIPTVLAPMIRALAPGQRVLLIVPSAFVKAPLWMQLIHRSSTRWEEYLKHDRRLRLVKSSAPYQFESGLAVRGILFVVRRSPPAGRAANTTSTAGVAARASSFSAGRRSPARRSRRHVR